MQPVKELEIGECSQSPGHVSLLQKSLHLAPESQSVPIWGKHASRLFVIVAVNMVTEL